MTDVIEVNNWRNEFGIGDVDPKTFFASSACAALPHALTFDPKQDLFWSAPQYAVDQLTDMK